MGQKSNPLITRINSKTKITKSVFYGKNLEESSYYLYQDLEIRKYLNSILENNGILLSDCRIQRSNNDLNISIDFYPTTAIVSKWKSLINTIKHSIKESELKNNNFNVNYLIQKKKSNLELFYTVKSIILQKKLKRKKSLKKDIKTPDLFFKLKNKLGSKLDNKNFITVNKLNNFLLQKKIIKTLFKFTNLSKVNLNFNNLQNNQLLKQDYKELNIYNKKIFYKETINIINLIYNKRGSAQLLAKYIILQFQTLKKHNLFLIFLKRVLQYYYKLDNTQIKGIKIIINGRFNGAPRSRGKIIQYGKLPLQTITQKIDYYYDQSHSIYGVFGVKVWICKK